MATLSHGNIFARLPRIKNKEIFQELVKNKKFLLERIISLGQKTPEGRWLKESRDEWVIVLKGNAVLRFQDRKELMKLKAGDYVLIPKNTRHRVEWTSPNRKTVWLALHF